MKRIVSFVLLLLFLYNFIGYFPVFEIMQQKIKADVEKEIKTNLRNRKLEVLRIPRSVYQNPGKNFHRVNEHEISWNGNLYDIVKQEVSSDTIIIYAVHDKAEENLFSMLDHQIKNYVDSNKPLKNKGSGKPVKNSIKEYFFEYSRLCFKLENESLEQEFYSVFLPSANKTPPDLPPELT
jgi:hypothetical protein